MGTRMDSDNYWLRRTAVSRRRWLGGAVAVSAGAAGLAMVGCGDDDAAKPTTTSTTSGVGAVTPSASPTPEPVGKKGGELRVALDDNPVSLDPHIESSYRTQWVIGPVYNRILNLTSDLVIRPELATAWEQADPTTLTLKLQPGVKFHNVAPVNGRVMTAEDVIWSINRIATNKPEFQRRYMFEAISSMTAPDANTVSIKLSQPFAPLLGYLANPFNSIAPKEAAADGDLRTKAIGTGPFLYKEGQRGVAYKLVRNPDYWEKDRPYLDAYTVQIMPQQPSRLAALRAKQLDIEPVPYDQLGDFKSDSSFTVGEAAQGGWFSIRYVASKPPFNDPRVRHAIDLCIDRAQLINLVTAGVGKQMGPIPDALPDWALSKDEVSKLAGYRANKDQDIADAKKLLEAAGMSNFEFEYLFYAPADQNEQVAVVVQQQLQKAGIKMKLNKKEFAAWTPLTLALDYQMTGTGNGFRDNPDEYLYALFFSKSSRNSTGYNNPEIDKLLELQRTQLDNAQRKQTILEAQRKLVLEAPNTWAFIENIYEPRASYVKGFSPTYQANRARQFVRAWLDK